MSKVLARSAGVLQDADRIQARLDWQLGILPDEAQAAIKDLESGPEWRRCRNPHRLAAQAEMFANPHAKTWDNLADIPNDVVIRPAIEIADGNGCRSIYYHRRDTADVRRQWILSLAKGDRANAKYFHSLHRMLVNKRLHLEDENHEIAHNNCLGSTHNPHPPVYDRTGLPAFAKDDKEAPMLTPPRYYFTFVHRERSLEFGPYMTEHEAKAGFQRAYGYWPDDAISTRLYEPPQV